MRERCLIVGGGHAGGRAALMLRSLDYRGAVAIACAEADPPYERPPLSKALLFDPQTEIPWLAEESAYAAREIRLLKSAKVESVDLTAGRCRLAGGGDEPFDRLIITTGARPRRLSLPGADLPGVHILRDLSDARSISSALKPGADIVVIGGGLIGLEVAAAARERGARVSVVEAGPRLLARSAGPLIAAAAARLHRQNGVEFFFSRRPAAFEGSDRLHGVLLDNSVVLPADLAVVGIGVVPRDELAREAGLDCDDGVLVDERARASAPKIHSAGDVARRRGAGAACGPRFESWHNAQVQSVAAARDIVGAESLEPEAPWAWSDQYKDQIQTVGVLDETARQLVRGDPERSAFSVFYLKKDMLVGIEAFNRGPDIAYARRLVGRRVALGEKIAQPDAPLRRQLALADPETMKEKETTS